jgi:ArsR family transcriptional regulator
MNKLQEFLKLAANEDRFRMLLLLFQDKLCVCHMSGILNLSQPTVSKNLAKFRDTKFVESEKDGKYIYYSFSCDDDCVNNFLADIVKSRDNYPLFSEDSKKLIDKDQYLSFCTC